MSPMENEDGEKLFTIGQLAESCGVSRSTVLRLETEGLLEPAYQSPESGFRYYDGYGVSKAMQVQCLRDMGLSKQEIKRYYEAGGAAEDVLASLEQRLALLMRGVEEMRLRVRGELHLSVSEIELPELVCHARTATVSSPEEKYRMMYGTYREAVEKGYRLLATQPLTGLTERTDFLEGRFERGSYEYTACIPLDPAFAPDEAKRLSPCRALSVLHHGTYADVRDAYLLLGKEVRQRGLEPAGTVRGLGLVAPYVGREIAQENYVTRLALPVR